MTEEGTPKPGFPQDSLERAGYRVGRALPGEGARRLLLRPEAPGRRWLLRSWWAGGRVPGDTHPSVLPLEPFCTQGDTSWGICALGRGRLLAELPGPALGCLPPRLWEEWARVGESRGWLAPENLVWGPDGLRVLPSTQDGGAGMLERRIADARARLLPPTQPPTWCGITSAGAVRVLNEDTWRVRDDGEQRLALVVDGVGGFRAGELAAMVVADLLSATTPGPARARITEGITACQAWFDGYPGPEVGFGACFAAAVTEGRRLTLAWMGDVCVWRFGAEGLRPLNEAHLLVNELVRQGKLRPEEVRAHRLSSIVMRCVGQGIPPTEPDWAEVELAPGEQVLLASDGLWRTLGEEGMAAELKKARGPRDGVVRLHGAALEAGAPDNVTALLLGPYS